MLDGQLQKFSKIPRWNREVIVTEKIDGTNGQVAIWRSELIPDELRGYAVGEFDGRLVFAGSRNRWVTPGSDNFGFAAWVVDNMASLVPGLGEGRHFGEWYGSGIQRNYGLDHKRFALFNVAKWSGDERPACCHVVPELWRGKMEDVNVEGIMSDLKTYGSMAVPKFMNPEGIVIFHVAGGHLYKKTFENDEGGKG